VLFDKKVKLLLGKIIFLSISKVCGSFGPFMISLIKRLASMIIQIYYIPPLLISNLWALEKVYSILDLDKFVGLLQISKQFDTVTDI